MLVPIENTPRDYAWGSRTAISELLGTRASGGPEAELWLGTHPGSPARLVDGGAPLGSVAGDLPFLLKVLAASSPLSLQAHPDAEQARDGFAREEAAGVPLDASSRNYRDPYPKPELIYALSDPFRALCGFRPVAETLTLLDPAPDDPRLAPLIARLSSDADLGPVFRWLIEGGDEVSGVVDAVVSASEGRIGIAWEVVRTLAEAYPGDPGIAISLLLHSVDLRPGDALYLPAGNIHAYLHGTGIELMAASDNVLRGGLTPKHIDVPELLRVLDFRPLPVPYLEGVAEGSGAVRFAPEGGGFALDVLAGDAEVTLERPSIVVCVRGEVEIDSVPRGRGAAFYADGPHRIRSAAESLVVVASATG